MDISSKDDFYREMAYLREQENLKKLIRQIGILDQIFPNIPSNFREYCGKPVLVVLCSNCTQRNFFRSKLIDALSLRHKSDIMDLLRKHVVFATEREHLIGLRILCYTNIIDPSTNPKKATEMEEEAYKRASRYYTPENKFIFDLLNSDLRPKEKEMKVFIARGTL